MLCCVIVFAVELATIILWLRVPGYEAKRYIYISLSIVLIGLRLGERFVCWFREGGAFISFVTFALLSPSPSLV